MGLVLSIYGFLFHEIRTITSLLHLQCFNLAAFALAQVLVPSIRGKEELTLKFKTVTSCPFLSQLAFLLFSTFPLKAKT